MQHKRRDQPDLRESEDNKSLIMGAYLAQLSRFH